MTDAFDPDDELAALLALDALDPGEQADAELRLGTFATDYADVSAALAAGVASAPPSELRAEILRGATHRRAMGDAIDGVAPLAPIDAFTVTIAELATLLSTLDDADLDRAVRGRYERVRDLVAHLAGIDDLVLGWLGLQPIDDPELALDHVAVTRAAIDELAHLPAAELVAEWRRRAERVVTAARNAPADQPVQAHDIPTHVDGMLLLRTFEVWAHHEDILVALDHPLPELDPARGRLMSSQLAEALPIAVALGAETPPDAWVRLVLTGDGGGTYDLVFGAGAATGDPDSLVVADMVDVCRLAARRLTTEELAPVVEGDLDLAKRTLAAATAFARD
jgi:uncharacterized protein (TIGR03083 family)